MENKNVQQSLVEVNAQATNITQIYMSKIDTWAMD